MNASYQRTFCKNAGLKGIKAEGKDEWDVRKHGGLKRQIWRKIHIGVDEETLEVRVVGFTARNVGDAPMLPELLDQIPPDQDIGSVIADGAYGTRKYHDSISVRGAQAIIPMPKNAKPWKPTSTDATARNKAVRTTK